MSGLKMNYDKTLVVWIGSRRNSNVKCMAELNISWSPVTFRVFGVVYSTNVHETVLTNYENKLNERRQLLNTWSRRNIAPFWWIMVIKTIVISKTTHFLCTYLILMQSFSMTLMCSVWDGSLVS